MDDAFAHTAFLELYECRPTLSGRKGLDETAFLHGFMDVYVRR
jgi:hypothetical protein